MAAQATLGRAQVTVNPNPLSGGFATVRCELPKDGPATIRVIDASGRLVQSMSGIRNSSSRLDLRSLPAGVYLVKVEFDGGSATEKLIIER